MVEQEIAKLDGYDLWKIETSLKYDLCGSIYSLSPLSLHVLLVSLWYTIYFWLMTSLNQRAHTKKKPQEKFKLLIALNDVFFVFLD